MIQQKIYGYMRVSTREQNEDRQRVALLEMGVPEKQIYMDKLSGKDFERPQYKKLLRRLDSDSVLYIKAIDRLGRNYVDLNEQWRIITKENERINIKQRQAEGIQAAKERGVRFGRPAKPLPENFGEVYERWSSGEIIGKRAAALCDMPLSTFYKRVSQFKIEDNR